MPSRPLAVTILPAQAEFCQQNMVYKVLAHDMYYKNDPPGQRLAFVDIHFGSSPMSHYARSDKQKV